jgi:release factor glutamine methyltransferase
MTINSVKGFIHTYLETNLESLENNYPGINSRRLLDEFLHYTDLKEDDSYLGQGNEFLIHIESGYPLEYIQRCAYFYRSNFYVDENVLIPRSETEILVEDSVNFINQNHHDLFQVAEVGVGSFCIGLSVLAEANNKIHFWGGDISKEALETAKLNLFRLNSKICKDTIIDLELRDRLSGMSRKFDLIISNPPYIKEKEDFAGVHTQANKFEPHLALYLKDDEFDEWFNDFFCQSLYCLKDNGAFYMEGHEDSLAHLELIAKKYFTKTEIKKDYTGRDRFLHAYK